jgi:hypothetical protein
MLRRTALQIGMSAVRGGAVLLNIGSRERKVRRRGLVVSEASALDVGPGGRNTAGGRGFRHRHSDLCPPRLAPRQCQSRARLTDSRFEIAWVNPNQGVTRLHSLIVIDKYF